MWQPTVARAAGAILYLALAALWTGIAYWLWPSGISDIQFSHLTFDLVFRAGAAAIFVLLSIACVFGAIFDAFY